jgi:MFS family permease
LAVTAGRPFFRANLKSLLIPAVGYVDEALPMPPASRLYVYMVATVAAMGGFLFEYDLSIISGAMLYLKDVFGLDDVQEGFAMASAVIGCMLGSLLISAVSDPLGRKNALLLAAVLYGVGAIGTAFPGTLTEFNVYCAIGGIGVALSSAISPKYIAEIAPAKMRGRLVAINQLAIMVGCFAAALVSYAFARSSIDESWRYMFASECLPIALLMVGLFFNPRVRAGCSRRAAATNRLRLSNGSRGRLPKKLLPYSIDP